MKEKVSNLNFSQLYRKYGIIIIFVIMIIVASLLNPIFLTKTNITNVVRQFAVVMIISCGAQLVMLCGMIDLSPGAVLALSGCIGVTVFMSTGSILLAVLVAMAIGTLTGAFMGFVITKFHLLPFIMTLAMTEIARGFALIYTGGKPVSNLGDLTILGQGYVGIIPVPVLIMAICILLIWVLLNKTKFGRYIYAVGGNEKASEACGINTSFIKRMAYIINGAMVGLSGIVLMARVNSGQPGIGEGYEFDAITAIIVGGTSMSGGAGSILGTLVGGLIVGIINNILNLQNVSTYYQQVIKGVIIMLAVIIDIMTKSDSGKKARNK